MVGRCKSGKVLRLGLREHRISLFVWGMSASFAERFEDLRIWQQARRLVAVIYQKFGSNRDFAFRDQIQRAAVSTMTNIAEGFERGSAADFARFLDFSKGSSGEVRSLLYVAEDVNYVNPIEAESLRNDFEALSKGIAALRRSLKG